MNDNTPIRTETPPRNGKRGVGWLRRFVGRCGEIWKNLSAKNPMARLHLVFIMASTIGALGICGILFGFLGALLMIGSSPQDAMTWSKVCDALGKSLWRIVIGYGSAVVIHAVAQLYEKQNPPNAALSGVERKP